MEQSRYSNMLLGTDQKLMPPLKTIPGLDDSGNIFSWTGLWTSHVVYRGDISNDVGHHFQA